VQHVLHPSTRLSSHLLTGLDASAKHVIILVVVYFIFLTTSTLSWRAACRDDDVVVSGVKARKRDAAADEVKDCLGGVLCTCLVEKASDPPASSNSRLETRTTATMIPADLMLLVVNIQCDVD
jgi:hypothetical protein